MDAVVREIEIALGDAVADLGGVGDVVVDGGQAWLIHGAERVSVDVELLIGQWRVIASMQRQRKVVELARALVDRQRETREKEESLRPRDGGGRQVKGLDTQLATPETLAGAGGLLAAPPSPERRAAAPPPPEEPMLVAVGAPRPPPVDLPLALDDLPRRRDAPSRDPSAPPVAAAASTFSADREIEIMLRDALGGFGVAGIASVHSGQAELRAGGVPVSIDLDNLAEQWPLLPPDIRRRRVGDLARRLVGAQRGGGLRRGARRGTGIVSIPMAAMVVAGAGLVLAGRWYLGREREAEPQVAAPAETEEQAQARRARVCEAARNRLYAGASVGPFDMEGWYAELWLARAKPGEDLQSRPEIVALSDGGKLSVAADPALSALANGTVQIVEGFGAERAARSPGWSGVTVRFGGAYVGALLDSALRPRFLALADRLADALSADTGALYGRCAHLTHRELGAWFRGTDARSAAAALVYAAGMHAEQPAVDADALARLGGAGELDALRTAAAKVDVRALDAALGPHGGSVTKRAGKAVTLTFPLGGGTKATIASRSVARAMGVGQREP